MRYFKSKTGLSWAAISDPDVAWNYSTSDKFSEISEAQYRADVYGDTDEIEVCRVLYEGRCGVCDHPCGDYLANGGYQNEDPDDDGCWERYDEDEYEGDEE